MLNEKAPQEYCEKNMSIALFIFKELRAVGQNDASRKTSL